ncbi:hypothetical protein [Planomicrobium okeanokoites]|uniref:hypothetical protein n=1 Tax=Planomicrobium okeanokoites TaxID=244 RepID=UPI0009FF2689|nr:hypothetical protein [Planomicrobium okeanokoites]
MPRTLKNQGFSDIVKKSRIIGAAYAIVNCIFTSVLFYNRPMGLQWGNKSLERKAEGQKLLNREKMHALVHSRPLQKVCRNGFFLRSDADAMRNR